MRNRDQQQVSVSTVQHIRPRSKKETQHEEYCNQELQGEWPMDLPNDRQRYTENRYCYEGSAHAVLEKTGE